jgi:hypothetical protein
MMKSVVRRFVKPCIFSPRFAMMQMAAMFTRGFRRAIPNACPHGYVHALLSDWLFSRVFTMIFTIEVSSGLWKPG